MKTVRTVNVQELFHKKAFKDSNQVNFDVSDLARGTYYLRVTNSHQQKDKQVEMTRLVFE